MNRSLFHRLSDALWIAIVSFIVLLAVYVSVGRMLASLTGNYQQLILQELNHRLPFTLEARKVSAQWHSFTPSLVLEDLRLTMPTEPDHPLELAGGRIGLDVAGSLLNRNLQTTRLELDGLHLAGELTQAGQLRIRGFDGDDTALGNWAEQFILNIEHMVLVDVSLKLDLPGNEQRVFELDFELTRDGSRRRLEALLGSSRGLQVRALAKGIGDPFDAEAFAGQLYLDIAATDVGALMDLAAPRLPQLTLSGAANLEAWLNWDGGEPSVEARFQSRDLVVGPADEAWSVPLDVLSFEARAIERREHWGLSVAALEVARGEALVRVPRLQLDASGATLRLRANAVPLGPLTAIVGDMPSLPESAAAVIQELQPRGTLRSLQLQLDDINTPLSGWELLADFSEVEVLPWHGAPGVRGGRGHVSLAPGGGQVVLDSHDFSMVFPTVYESALDYEDFHGTFDLAWSEAAVTLSSQLVEALGPEGPVRVLFGLNIPLLESREGIEMDLLVGLQDSGPGHRGKYIPFVLDQGLRDWLQESIGDGLIEQGGFIWRGSLTAARPELHTVQLFFNIEDTALAYHPDWPSLAAVSGLVLIDDTQVSVWADSARLRDSTVTGLDVEVWTDTAGQLRLAVAGDLEGPAADGLAVINESPLAELTAGGFADWRLDGRLSTDIELLLNLSDPAAAPAVRVSALLDEVDMDVEPGNLPLRAISGQLDYSSGGGFSAESLVGQLWGKPLQAAVRQGEARSSPSSVAAGKAASATAATVIDLSSTLDMADVRSWLEQDWLAFARGEAMVTARMLIASGIAPSLTIESALEGVALDLPAPWAKPAAERRPLALELVFAGEETTLDIELEGGFNAGLVLADGGLRAAAIGFGEEGEPVLEQGVFRLGGRLEQASIDHWRVFADDYLTSGFGRGDAPATEDRGLRLQVDQLEVGELQWGENFLGEFVFQFGEQDETWLLAAQAQWLQARWMQPTSGGGEPQLAISRLDLAGLEKLQLTVGGDGEVVELPAMQVAVNRLEKSGEPLGSLNFALRSSGAVLQAENITGSILGMTLPAERPGRLEWRQGDDNRTLLALAPRFGNLGDTLTELGYPPFLVTDNGEFDVVLEWPGAPQAFELAAAEGVVRVDIGEGRFTEVSAGASGTLRVVSILNLAEIVRQLSLSHMFEAGIPFNTIQGEVFLHGGSIEVAKMDVEGGASSFQFTGVSEVKPRTLDGELVVTLPVANNLPWVAALTAGLPVAAGVFVLSKLFENQVNRLTSLVYRTSGSWDNPQVTFDRVFDDSAATTRAGSGQSSAP